MKGDEDDGLRRARERAQWIEQAPARVFLGRHSEALARAVTLRALVHGEVATIDFGDDGTETRRIVVIPGEPVSLGYASPEDETSARHLVERAARALDCELVLI